MEQYYPQGRSNRNTLNMLEKIQVIRDYQNNKTISQLVDKYQCSRSQIQRILREKEEYLAEWARNSDSSRVRKSRPTKAIALGVLLYEWVQRCRCYNVEITDTSLKKNATAIAEMIESSGFQATNRFLERFKKKFKISDSDLKDMNRLEALQSNNSKRKCTKLSKVIEDIKQAVAETGGFSLDKILEDDMAWRTYERNILNSLKGIHYTASDQLYDSYSSESNPCEYNGDMFEMNTTNDATMNESNDVTMTESNDPQIDSSKEVNNYRDALNHLGPLEQFALFKENIRAIGLINQLENIFRDNMTNSSVISI